RRFPDNFVVAEPTLRPFHTSQSNVQQGNKYPLIGGVDSQIFNISGSCRQASRRDICQQLMVIQFKEGKHSLRANGTKIENFSSLNYKIFAFSRRN
ncbi:MAG: hypothetical protein IKT27_01255, partial [Clostridia bacterium]|nr:hypothetical protein [Clostridia bacterium]